MADDDRTEEPGAEREAEGPADAAAPPPGEERAAKGRGRKKSGGERDAGESEPEPEEPLSPEQVADALALLSTYFHLMDRTYAEVDELLGKRPGYTGKILHGRRPYTPEIGRAIRQALGVPEDAARKDMAQREALRELRVRTGSWLPNPDQRRARHPRPRPGGRKRASEVEEPAEASRLPEVMAQLGQLEDGLRAALGLEKPTEPPPPQPPPGRRSRRGAKRGKADRT